VTIDTIAVVTARRAPALARCITSYGHHAARFARRPSFLVSDDSLSPRDREACVAGARKAAANCGAEVVYVGAIEKLEILRGMVATGAVPPDIIAFAFSDAEQVGRNTNGANRNLLLWLTHGSSLYVVDDDTICDTYRPSGASDVVRVVRGAADERRDPSEVWPLGSDGERDDERREGMCRAQAIDVLGEHERWLGKRIAIKTRVHPALAPTPVGPPARVAVTTNGLIGDCGWGSPAEYLFLRDASRDRLTKSDAAYRASVTSRQIVRAVRQPVLSERVDDFMSTFLAIDNRLVLPPFMPVCRGTGRVFARLVSLCRPGWFAHLPFVLRHEPVERRRFPPGEICRSAAGIDLSRLVCCLLDTLPRAHHTDPAARLMHYGRALTSVASQGVAGFRELAVDCVRSALARTADALEARADAETDHLSLCRRDTLAYAASLRRTIARPDVHIPLDLRSGRSLDDAEAVTRRLVFRFGRLLACWPDVLDLRAHSHLEPRGLRLLPEHGAVTHCH
jgi:hypothetical protein